MAQKRNICNISTRLKVEKGAAFILLSMRCVMYVGLVLIDISKINVGVGECVADRSFSSHKLTKRASFWFVDYKISVSSSTFNPNPQCWDEIFVGKE